MPGTHGLKNGGTWPSPTGHLRQQSLIVMCKLWRLVNEILDQSNLLWSSWQLLFLVPPLQPHYPNRNHGPGGAQGALATHNPPGFSMVNKVNLLLWDLVLLRDDFNIHGTNFFLKLQNTTDLFYRLKSIPVTFLFIDISLVKSIYDKALFTKSLNMFSISPCDSQVPSNLACGARSLV